MKKSTLIVLLLAIIAGAAFYCFDWKRGQKDAWKDATAADTSKAAFTAFKPEDVATITLTLPGATPIQFARRNTDWQITQPIVTLADGPTLGGIAQALAGARIAETQPGTPDRLKVYGLDPPAAVIDFQLQNGTKHTVQLGKKDFVGTSVYSKIDSGKDVALLPDSLVGLASKSLAEYRDQSVFHLRSDQISSFDLKNASGEIVASKDGQTWKLLKPAATFADAAAVDELLAAVPGGKMVSVVAETPDNLAKYGLAAPGITFTATDAKGKSATLLVGKKEGENYFAREASLPVIFTVGGDFQKKLSDSFADLRDKKIAHFDPATITHIDIQNASGAISITRKGEDDWTFDAPAELKGKSASAEKLFSAIEQARAEHVFDTPPSGAAEFAKPSFEAVLTSKDGKKLTISVALAPDGFADVRASDAATVYRVKRQLLNDLNFKATDMAF